MTDLDSAAPATPIGRSLRTGYGRLLRTGERIAPGPKPNGDDPSVDPRTWILLAEDALSAGRPDQAEELVEQAYRECDEAITNATAWWLGSEKEKTQLDPK
jgi:hypothetical protein